MKTGREWRAIVAGLMAAGCAWGALRAWPAAELEVLVRGAAHVAALLLGAPTWRFDVGWALPMERVPLLVTSACSGADFFVIVSGLIGWRLRTWFAAPAAFAVAVPVTILINGLRIVCLAAAHRWVIPRFPPSWDGAAHMVAGVAVFLPGLIALNLLLELYARHTHRPAVGS